MGAAAIPLLIAGSTVATVYAVKKSSEEAKATRKAAVKEAEKQRKWQEQQLKTELQAGEYFEELKAEQMELQAQAANIRTLANLIESRREQQASPVVFTLPAAKIEKYDPVYEINKAIHSVFAG